MFLLLLFSIFGAIFGSLRHLQRAIKPEVTNNQTKVRKRAVDADGVLRLRLCQADIGTKFQKTNVCFQIFLFLFFGIANKIFWEILADFEGGANKLSWQVRGGV